MKRCDWVGGDPLYQKYHDQEWGVPVHDDQRMFEFLVLESFQAGLSWFTILKKRDNFRKAFDQFDYFKVALYDDKKVERLMADAGIVRNRLKILAAINNARCFVEVRREWGEFCKYLWSFTEGQVLVNQWESSAELPAKTELSDKVSKDLQKRGFKFLGSTTVYAHLQACGIINDHQTDCFRYSEVKS